MNRRLNYILRLAKCNCLVWLGLYIEVLKGEKYGNDDDDD